MPAYKDEKRNTWLSLFYYEDWQGNKKKKQKRGFKTKKEALEWENNWLFGHIGGSESSESLDFTGIAQNIFCEISVG